MVSELLKQAEATRELAKRARRLAKGLAPADEARLLKHAWELEEQAAELERQIPKPTSR
jgi:hypothetical protein